MKITKENLDFTSAQNKFFLRDDGIIFRYVGWDTLDVKPSFANKKIPLKEKGAVKLVNGNYCISFPSLSEAEKARNFFDSEKN